MKILLQLFFLLQNGADLTALDCEKKSPFFYAFSKSNRVEYKSFAWELLKRGVNIKNEYQRGVPLLEAAQIRGDQYYIEKFAQFPAKMAGSTEERTKPSE